MKFFSKDFYEKYQLSEYLIYADSEEELEKNKQSYEEHEMDFNKLAMEEFIENKLLMLKHLPQSLKYSIYDESIMNNKIPHKDVLEKIQEWKQKENLDQGFTKKFIEYDRHYKRVEKLLPRRIKKIKQEYNFHDAKILSIDTSRSDRLIIKLDCSGYFMYSGECTLHFNGVRSLELPDKFIGSYWLYDELYISNIGNFDFQALIHNCNTNEFLSLYEFRVVADEFFIKKDRFYKQKTRDYMKVLAEIIKKLSISENDNAKIIDYEV